MTTDSSQQFPKSVVRDGVSAPPQNVAPPTAQTHDREPPQTGHAVQLDQNVVTPSPYHVAPQSPHQVAAQYAQETESETIPQSVNQNVEYPMGQNPSRMESNVAPRGWQERLPNTVFQPAVSDAKQSCQNPIRQGHVSTCQSRKSAGLCMNSCNH